MTELEFERSGCECSYAYCLWRGARERLRTVEISRDLYCAATTKRQVRFRLYCHAASRCFTSNICNVARLPMCHSISQLMASSIRAPKL